MGWDSGDGRNPYDHIGGERRNRTVHQWKKTLQRIPGIENVRFDQDAAAVEVGVLAEVNTAVFADGIIPCDEASVVANYWSRAEGDTPWFQIHYWDETEYNCGWHRQVNDHVDGLDHYQQGENEETETYEPVTFEAENPVGLMWEVVDKRLVDRLKDRYG